MLEDLRAADQILFKARLKEIKGEDSEELRREAISLILSTFPTQANFICGDYRIFSILGPDTKLDRAYEKTILHIEGQES